jgi:Fe-S cluster assembly iron-binding protein IscA
MIDITSNAASILKRNMLQSCFDAGIGYRLAFASKENGDKSVILKIDQVQEEDEILDLDGLKIFIDRDSLSLVRGGEIDYIYDAASFIYQGSQSK